MRFLPEHPALGLEAADLRRATCKSTTRPANEGGVSDTVEVKVCSPAVAATLYTETPESIANREQAARERRLARPLGADLGLRPTKQARRRLDALRRYERDRRR